MPSDCGRVIEVELTLALSRGALVTIDADGSGAVSRRSVALDDSGRELFRWTSATMSRNALIRRCGSTS